MRIKSCKKRVSMMTFSLPLEKNNKETEKKKILKKTNKQEVFIDFRIFLVYNSTMISQDIVTIDSQAAGPIISRSKLR